jgi:putative chitinase
MRTMLEVFTKIAPRAYPNYKRAFENDAALFAKFKINTPLRIAHFLAQTMYECGRGTILFENLRYTTAARLLKIFGVGNHSAAVTPEEAPGLLNNPEKLGERVYGLGNPRKARELGNTHPGDGYRYRGGGLMQTTGGGAYQRMGEKARADFAGDPNLIVAPEYAVKPALYEWDEGNLNEHADKNDIRQITRVINGGYNGLPGRQALFNEIWAIVNDDDRAPAAWAAAHTDEDTRELQEALNDLGGEPQVLVDGRYGPETVEAVKWFQRQASLQADGVAGDVTRAAIRLRLAQRRG